MLRQERISLIALCVSIAGISLLFLFSATFEPKEMKIREIDDSMLEWPVRVNATILSSHQRNSVAIMQLYDGTGKIKAVLFSPSREQQSLIAKDSFASFEGKVQLYENELEIVVERVQAWR